MIGIFFGVLVAIGIFATILKILSYYYKWELKAGRRKEEA